VQQLQKPPPVFRLDPSLYLSARAPGNVSRPEKIFDQTGNTGAFLSRGCRGRLLAQARSFTPARQALAMGIGMVLGASPPTLSSLKLDEQESVRVHNAAPKGRSRRPGAK